MAKRTRSGRKHLSTIIFFMASSHLVSHSPGSWNFSGSGFTEENHLYQSFGFSWMAEDRPWKISICFSNSQTLSQAWSVIQCSVFGGLIGYPSLCITVPPLRKN